jgi:hypothetical protein
VERLQTEPVPAGQKCFEVQPGGFSDGEKTRLRDGVQVEILLNLFLIYIYFFKF